MSNVLKAVILLFILVSIDCKLASQALEEIITALLPKELKTIPCGKTMVPEVKFEGVKAEVFCKAAKALAQVSACEPLDITGLRLNLNKTDNCTVNENEVMDLFTFLKRLRKFSQKVFRD